MRNRHDGCRMLSHGNQHVQQVFVCVSQAKEPWSMSDEEKLEAAQLRKEKGNAQFKAGKWAAALAKYKVRCHQPCSTLPAHLLQSSLCNRCQAVPRPSMPGLVLSSR